MPDYISSLLVACGDDQAKQPVAQQTVVIQPWTVHDWL